MQQFRTQTPDSSTAGFTLLELLVVVIMVGVLAALVSPSWLSYMNRQRVNRARGDLAQIIRSAQSDAQQKNTTRIVRFSGAAGISAEPAVQVNSSTGITTGIKLSVGGNRNDSIRLTANTQEFIFNYKGEAAPGNSADFPYIVLVTSELTKTPTCIVVPTILGGIVQGNGDECDASRY